MASITDTQATAVVRFWREAGASQWFAKAPAFDRRFRERFLDLHRSVVRGERDAWLDTPKGALVRLILVDQFPRNAFRGTADMYATDILARHFARLAQASGYMEAVRC
ncbi:DUF924 family protein [Pseudomonas chlororaphis]|uniref:DUF924 family protein n=1 Tax=Pseudomonas chlororaphis TaxID=587753 RepID=UPI001CEFA35F|nr:DUF924 family protein [Pseudomonas chlororaphis]